MQLQINDKIFREYDIRGIADRDLPDPVVERLGLCIAQAVKAKGGKRVTVGRDCRVSSPRIAAALTKGLNSGGVDTVDIGMIPTPLSYFSVFALPVDGAVMVTGSHNPPEHNGFKTCIGKTTIYGDEIQALKKQMYSDLKPIGGGTRTTAPIIPDYLNHVSKGFKGNLGVRVVVDSGNGTGGVVAPELYRRLGCEVEELFSEPDGRFPNHHPDPTLPENLEHLIDRVRRSDAALGIAFDGDSDRIGVVDGSGRILFGDELLVIFARALLKKSPGATVISEVKASHRLFQDVDKHGGKPILWKTGHSLIKSKMKETGAVLAGEMSGHMFFGDRYFGYDDAIYAGARLLEIVSETKKRPAELIADLPPSHSTPEIRVDCPDEKKFQVVEMARELLVKEGHKVNPIDGARVEFADGWGLVRASNTQPVLVYRFEAISPARLEEIRKTVESAVNRAISSV